MAKNAISPTRAENYPEWYQQVIKAAELAESAPVRGCMVIKPWGYALWERIQQILDQKLKQTGHKNFYCPLFVPLSFIAKEAEHVDGFAKECAVITHHRLENDANGNLAPAGKLEEPLIVRPTSEALIGDLYSKWVNSYRDLPLLYNQWANVVRWEMRPRLFLRTSEFLWQEGHTAHATQQEAQAHARKMLDVYLWLVQDCLAMPVIPGCKTQAERFPGAVVTYTFEAMMQDGKALQGGTSHYLGENFARAFNIKYLSQEGKEEFVHTTSWGVTTRLIGSLIMMHGDDDGICLPPKIAPTQIVIVPLVKKTDDREQLLTYCQTLADQLREQSFAGEPLRVEIDASDGRPGEKLWGWVKKGVPLRVEIGGREMAEQAVSISRRDQPYGTREVQPVVDCVTQAPALLAQIQTSLFTKAAEFQAQHTQVLHSEAEFYQYFKADNPGFARVFCQDQPALEAKLQKDLKVTARCIPLADNEARGNCIFTGQSDCQQIIFARAY